MPGSVKGTIFTKNTVIDSANRVRMHVNQTMIRVFGFLWFLLALLVSIGIPYVSSISCAYIINPGCADQRWYILHALGGSFFWMQDVILALTLGFALVAVRFRFIILALCAFFIIKSLAIPVLMIRAPDVVPFNSVLAALTVLAETYGIATLILIMRKKTTEIFNKKTRNNERAETEVEGGP